MTNAHTKQDLQIMQAWPLERKIQVTQTRIIEWYQHYEGKVYVSFSGGKDSTVLLDLARRIYPDIEAVFVDTGLEYPEIRDFVKTKGNVTWLKPDMTFGKVIEKYGYPVISKEVSRRVYDVVSATKYDKPSYATKMFNGDYRDKKGNKSQYNIEQWKFLLNAPFLISNRCCDVMKKRPVHRFAKISGKRPITGQMAGESKQREAQWVQFGCNGFNMNAPISNPLSFWTEQDVLQYLKRFKIPYCSVYGDIVESEELEGQERLFETNPKLTTTGCKRTGCMFCMFGVHLEDEPNRFQLMAITHPKQYDYCINHLGLGKVMNFIGVNYKPPKWMKEAL